MLKGEDHVQLSFMVIRIPAGLLRCAAGFPDSEQVILAEDFFTHFPDIPVRGFGMCTACTKTAVRRTILLHAVQVVFLADHGNDVHPEAVDPFPAPPVHHIKDFLAYGRVCPVQVRLFP